MEWIMKWVSGSVIAYIVGVIFYMSRVNSYMDKESFLLEEFDNAMRFRFKMLIISLLIFVIELYFMILLDYAKFLDWSVFIQDGVDNRNVDNMIYCIIAALVIFVIFIYTKKILYLKVKDKRNELIIFYSLCFISIIFGDEICNIIKVNIFIEDIIVIIMIVLLFPIFNKRVKISARDLGFVEAIFIVLLISLIMVCVIVLCFDGKFYNLFTMSSRTLSVNDGFRLGDFVIIINRFALGVLGIVFLLFNYVAFGIVMKKYMMWEFFLEKQNKKIANMSSFDGEFRIIKTVKTDKKYFLVKYIGECIGENRYTLIAHDEVFSKGYKIISRRKSNMNSKYKINKGKDY